MYELPDHTGKTQKLSQLQGNDPLALMLARGGYCPKEHLQHVWMAAMQAKIKVGIAGLLPSIQILFWNLKSGGIVWGRIGHFSQMRKEDCNRIWQLKNTPTLSIIQ